jgi:hypothetical protein
MPLPDPGFHDTLVPRLGGTWHQALSPTTTLAVRAGYAFVPTPAPDDARSGLLDNHRHVGALGVGLHAPDATFPLHLDAFFQVQRLVPRTQDRGDQPGVEASGSIVVGGLSFGVDL